MTGCGEVRGLLLDYQRGRLPLEAHEQVAGHLAGCSACAHADAAERELTGLLEERLPQHPASLALKRRLAMRWPADAAPARRRGRWYGALVPVLAVAAALVVAVPVARWQIETARQAAGTDEMVTETVNDHLRVLGSQRPLEIESGGIHQVKPWFAGRLDFAPAVGFAGDADFPLKGGAVGYFRDRRAAVFVYGRRLHTISLFVFRADGLPWPARGVRDVGGVDVYATAERGFNVVLWRQGELGYALVSDVDASELSRLARLVAGT